MISREQLESYRALAAKRGHDSVDASKALLALPVLLAEIDEKQQLIAELIGFAEDYLLGQHDWQYENVEARKACAQAEALKARAGL